MNEGDICQIDSTNHNCPLCNYRNFNKYEMNLSRHVERDHPDGYKENGERRFKCQLSGKSYAYVDNLCHMRTYKEKDKTVDARQWGLFV